MIITIHHNGFHGRKTVRVKVDPADVEHEPLYPGEFSYSVSPRVARRINMAVCPSADCKCGEHIATCTCPPNTLFPGGMWTMPMPDVQGGVTELDLMGNYPQR